MRSCFHFISGVWTSNDAALKNSNLKLSHLIELVVYVCINHLCRIRKFTPFCFLDGKLQEDFELVLCDILHVDYNEKRSTTTLSTL